MEKGETLINCLAYIDLNPVRAGIVEKPEDYRWSSLGYHLQTGNKDGFLSTDFGLRELNPPCGKPQGIFTVRMKIDFQFACIPRRKQRGMCSLSRFNVKSESERVRLYRKYVYEAGAIVPGDKPYAKKVAEKVVAKARQKDFEISRTDRFLYRTRYFTDSGIIGSRAFVSGTYQQFRHLFQSRHEKKPRAVKGLDGMFSLKRLVEP